jgi:hypothetical protein
MEDIPDKPVMQILYILKSLINILFIRSFPDSLSYPS